MWSIGARSTSTTTESSRRRSLALHVVLISGTASRCAQPDRRQLSSPGHHFMVARPPGPPAAVRRPVGFTLALSKPANGTAAARAVWIEVPHSRWAPRAADEGTESLAQHSTLPGRAPCPRCRGRPWPCPSPPPRQTARQHRALRRADAVTSPSVNHRSLITA